jgi:uncharacterized membrane protein (DUF2068 family)
MTKMKVKLDCSPRNSPQLSMNTLNVENPASTTGNSPPQAPQKRKGLILIGIFKIAKGTMLLILALGMLRLLHHDVQEWAEDLIASLRFDPDNRHIAGFLAKLGLVNDHELKELSGLTFIYAGLFLTEGIGLIRQKRWAEYLTVIATSSLIPVEIYEVFRHVTFLRVLLFLGNVAILAYLLVVIRKNATSHGAESPK